MKVFVSMPVNTSATDTFFDEPARKYLEEKFEVVYYPYDHYKNASEIMELAKDCDVIMTGWGHPMLKYDDLKDTNIKIIAHTGGTVGNIAHPSLYENGIKIMSGNILYAESVAEGTIGYMMLGLRRIYDYIEDVRDGNWTTGNEYTEGLLDATIGIVGLGTISRYLVKMLQTFRAKIKIYSSYPIDEGYLKENNAVQASLEEIFSTCKIVSLHSSMNSKTQGMIGKEHFDLLKDGSLFINTARGAIIREEEMIEALKENRFNAVLDVYCKEPLDSDSELRSLKNVYSIPHMAGPTIDRRSYITRSLADNVIKISEGLDAELEISQEVAKRMTVGM